MKELLDDGGGLTDDESAFIGANSFELAPGDGWPAALLSDLGEGGGVAGEEVVRGLLVGFGDVAEGVDADLEFLGGVSCAAAGLAVQVDEGAEAMGFAANDGDHEREAEGSGAGEGLRCSADAEPDGEWILERPGEDALAGEGRAMLAGPVDECVLAEVEEEVEFLGEEVVVVLEIEAEEREGLDEGAAADDDFCAATGDEVEGGELLEDADGIGGAEDGDGAGETDLRGAGGRGGEDDGGGGIEVLLAVVLAETEGVEADLVGEFDLLKEVTEALGGCGGDAGGWVRNCGCEAVDADLHLRPSGS